MFHCITNDRHWTSQLPCILFTHINIQYLDHRRFVPSYNHDFLVLWYFLVCWICFRIQRGIMPVLNLISVSSRLRAYAPNGREARTRGSQGYLYLSGKLEQRSLLMDLPLLLAPARLPELPKIPVTDPWFSWFFSNIVSQMATVLYCSLVALVVRSGMIDPWWPKMLCRRLLRKSVGSSYWFCGDCC